MNLLKKIPIPALTFFVGILVGTLVTQVFAHGGDASFIHACVKSSNGSLRIVGANDTCDKGETALDWRQGPEPGTEFPLILGGVGNLENRLSGRNLQNAAIQAQLGGTNLTNSDFTNSNFQGSLLIQNTDLSNSNFTNANLRAVLVSSNFTNANLIGADLQGSMIGFVNFTGANFTNANLLDAFICSDSPTDPIPTITPLPDASLPVLTGATWSNTTCPDGTNSDNNGGTCQGHFTVIGSCHY